MFDDHDPGQAPTAAEGDVVRAGLVTGPGEFELVDFEVRDPGPRQVRVDISLCGLCVAEVKGYRSGGGHGPSLCGHEWVGLVSAVGGETQGLVPGQKVVIAVPEPCGDCAACRAGRAHFCEAVMTVARGRDRLAPPYGGFARSITVADYRVLPVPPGLSDVAAAMVEPAAVALHGVSRGGVSLGDTVVVLGAGPIGLFTLQWARVAGAARTIVVEPLEERRAMAEKLHADLVAAPDDSDFLRVIDQGGADVVFDCVGEGTAVQRAVDLIRPGGTVVILGDAPAATIAPRLWLAKEVSVVAAAGYARSDIERTAEYMAAGRLLAEPLHTRTIALDQLGEVLQEMVDGTARDIKVLVDPRLPPRS
ncbi:alcohol dehydrogenase [Streptomyces sp. NWU339]|uniref:zinc-dependent alcohol dehydrogenase n=1 Tax=Streptomyces sp. NWU339 TaxID=2185284 RepID=UPI000D683915|nr:zinc-binding dehydrogenase [Streptomyces sp. NWU339]PWI06645.1 alcohol dehydrogenase [Streptomyces sp. NWU339]